MSITPPPRPQALGPAAVDALLLDTTPWLSCDDCFRLVDRYVEALLSDVDEPAPAELAAMPAPAAVLDQLVARFR